MPCKRWYLVTWSSKAWLPVGAHIGLQVLTPFICMQASNKWQCRRGKSALPSKRWSSVTWSFKAWLLVVAHTGLQDLTASLHSQASDKWQCRGGHSAPCQAEDGSRPPCHSAHGHQWAHHPWPPRCHRRRQADVWQGRAGVDSQIWS